MNSNRTTSRRILGSMFSGGDGDHGMDEESAAPRGAPSISIPRVESLQHISVVGGHSPTGSGNESMRFTSSHVRGTSFDMDSRGLSRSSSPPIPGRPRSPQDVILEQNMLMEQESHRKSSSSSSSSSSLFSGSSGGGGTATGGSGGDNENGMEPVVDEVPLLQELGINFAEIWTKSLFVLNPFRRRINKGISSQDYQRGANMGHNSGTMHAHDLLDDKDLAGPLLFCLALGTVLLLSGKVHFGYIYGVGTLGCLAIYVLLNLIHQRPVELQRTASILGYGLLPMVLLGICKTVVPLIVHSRTWSVVALVLGFVVVVWSTMSATSLFMTTLRMYDHKWILAYPILLVYITFALITVF